MEKTQNTAGREVGEGVTAGLSRESGVMRSRLEYRFEGECCRHHRKNETQQLK
jgi:hypothetical protein